MGDNWQYIDPKHQKLWKSMQRIEQIIEDKGLTETENPTLRAVREGKPVDTYWSERFKGWLGWPMRYTPPTTKKGK